MGAPVPQEKAQARLYEVPGGIGQPEQHCSADRRNAGHKAEQLREAEALGLGEDTGTPVQSKRQEPFAGTGPGGWRNIHRPDEEHPHIVPCG